MRTKQARSSKDSNSRRPAAAALGVLVWLLLNLLPVREANAQGTVIFSNRIPGGLGIGITLHIWGPDPVGGLSLIGRGSSDNPSGTTSFEASRMALIGAGGSGGHYGYATTFAQLIGAVGAGRPPSDLVPIGLTTTFRSGAGLGAVVPIIDRLFGIPKDATAATFAIVAWDNSSGAFPTWAQASVAWMRSQIRAGVSAPFTVTAIGGDINPPPYLNNNQGGANGMTSFNLYGDCLDPMRRHLARQRRHREQRHTQRHGVSRHGAPALPGSSGAAQPAMAMEPPRWTSAVFAPTPRLSAPPCLSRPNLPG